MTTQEIADRLVQYCNEGQFEAAQKELFAPDAVSIEPREAGGFPKEVHGLPAIIEKGKQFQSMVEAVHSCKVSDPLVSGNAIAFKLTMDITMKGRGREGMAEICVYEVKDGRIIAERFFD